MLFEESSSPTSSVSYLKKKSTSMSGNQMYRRCVFSCPRYITDGDSHEMCVSCLGMEHARAALEGAACARCEALSVRVLRYSMALFSEDGRMCFPRGVGPAAAEAARRLHSWVHSVICRRISGRLRLFPDLHPLAPTLPFLVREPVLGFSRSRFGSGDAAAIRLRGGGRAQRSGR